MEKERQSLLSITNLIGELLYLYTNVKELDKKVDKSLYTILKRNDPYSSSAHSNRVVFEVYEGSVYELVSVTGAQIKAQTNDIIVLENSPPMNVLVVNERVETSFLKTMPV